MTAPITSREELLACPFCGGAPTLDEHPPSPGDDDSFVVIRCCGFSKEYSFASNAIKWWNTRAVPAQGTMPEDAQLRRAAMAQLNILDHWGTKEGGAHVSSAVFQNAAFTIRKLVDALPAPRTSETRAAIAEFTEIMMLALDGRVSDEGLGIRLRGNLPIFERATEVLCPPPSTGLPAPTTHAEVREALGEQQIEILAKRVAGAELNYRNSYEKNGGDHIETGRNWDLMRRSGDAIRQHFYEREEASQQDRGGQ